MLLVVFHWERNDRPLLLLVARSRVELKHLEFCRNPEVSELNVRCHTTDVGESDFYISIIIYLENINKYIFFCVII